MTLSFTAYEILQRVVILTYPRNRAGLNDWIYEKAQKSSS